MTIALRAHHLLCALTYVGKGYSYAFIANYDAIAARLTAGERVRIVAGPDDICQPLCQADDAPHCVGPGPARRDRQAARAIEPLLGCSLAVGASLTLDANTLARLRTAFAAGSIRDACEDCEWHSLCTHVAADGYARTRV